MITNNISTPAGEVFAAKCCGQIRNSKHCPDCGSYLGIHGKTAKITLRIPEELYFELSAAAHREGINENQFCALAIHGAIHGGSGVAIEKLDPPDAGIVERAE